jgi:hypothetical protein
MHHPRFGLESAHTTSRRAQIQNEFSRAGDHSALSTFVTLTCIPSILTGCLTCHLTKCSCEISLAGKVEFERNVDQGLISAYQQRFGTFKTPRADVLMRRLTCGGLECSREMEKAQASNRCQVIDRKIAFQVSLYVVQYAGQSATIESFLCDTRESLSR